MTDRKFDIAIVGATGLVGSELLESLERRRFPVRKLRAFASVNSAGESIEFMDAELEVEAVSSDFYQDSQIVFFATHPLVSRDLASEATEAGAFVIDASRHFRNSDDAVMVVPEVNAEAMAELKDGKRIISSPSALSVGLATLLKPIGERFGLKAVSVASTHGSTCAGRKGFEEHQFQTIGVFNQSELAIERFPRRAAFNVFPQVGMADGDDSFEAEVEVMNELPRLLGGEINVSVTSMFVPIFCGISAVVSFELETGASLDAVRGVIDKSAGVLLLDNTEQESYPDSLLALEQDEVLAGRVRVDPTRPKGFTLWISFDNLRRGASDNMVAIAELLARIWDGVSPQ
jgi:aspartate-semialdehyde dehydrogenase